MQDRSLQWKILGKLKKKNSGNSDIIDILLKNRELKTKKEKKEFFNAVHPAKIKSEDINIDKAKLEKAIKRINKAIEKKEKIIIYGDYDTDGVCATAILWECIYEFTKNVYPYLPDRFSEGYGINPESLRKIINVHPDVSLIITVDNGIVASQAVDEAAKIGVDVIITDHHLKGKILPKAYCIIHTKDVSGTGIAWFISKEIRKKLRSKKKEDYGLDLVAIGTVSDQMKLTGINRSFAKYGLSELNKTERLGLLSLFSKAGIKKGNIGTYEINFMIAPRINAMGRLEHAIDSLRLLCTSNLNKARELADLLERTNQERQKVLEDALFIAKEDANRIKKQRAILVSHQSYHEGIIGLTAAKLVEEFWRPAIVISQGKEYSKASARSIPGFNIIETIRSLDEFIIAGGGHPMAAGFTLRTEKIEIFSRKFSQITKKLLSKEILTKKLSIDVEIDFSQINQELVDLIQKFEPTGIGNPAPVFATYKVKVLDANLVGAGKEHLRLKIEKDGKVFSAIGFKLASKLQYLSEDKSIDIAYNLEMNIWNSNTSIQLKLKDIKC